MPQGKKGKNSGIVIKKIQYLVRNHQESIKTKITQSNNPKTIKLTKTIVISKKFQGSWHEKERNKIIQ